MTTAQINTINRNKSAQLNFIYVDTTNHQYPIYYIGLQDGTLKQQTTTSASIGAITPLSIVSLSPLFTASVNTTSTSQDIIFAQIPQAANTFYGGPTSGLDANPTFRILTTADLPAGTGTVTNFSAGNLSPLFTTSVATPTTTPVLSFTLNTQTANTIFAGPTTGAAATPTFRSLVSADIPTLTALYWTLNGNTVGAEKWIGTIDSYSFPIRINNSEVGRFLYSGTASINGNFGINIASPSAKLHIKGYDTSNSIYGFKVEDSSSTLNFSIRNDGQTAVGGGADAFYQMKINTSPTFIGGLFINNGARTGYCLELSGSVGHGAYITVPTNQNAIEVIAGRSQFGGIVGIGSAAQAASSLRVTSDGTFSTASCIRIENTASSGTHYGVDIGLSTAGTQIQYGVYLDVSGGATNYSLFSIAGNVNLQSIPIGNAGLVAGDLYKDTAANILANGDYVVGIKV